jgi:16S rRNA (cytosine967-C5)-methyltransferase
LNTSKIIIEAYNGSMPLAPWLKQFFKANKKFGSKDRKEISHACYCFYRLGNAFQQLRFEERMLTGLFLCSFSSNKIINELKPEWNETIVLPLNEKIKLIPAQEEIKSIFPFFNELSEEIDREAFNDSFLIQPDLYLRIRPGKKEKVIRQLQKTSLEFALPADDCIQLPNQSKLDGVNIDEDVVVQDFNSQKVVESFDNCQVSAANRGLNVWDCCGASGGKSILFYDHFPNIHLAVSDIRESILINLQKRFKKAGIKNYDYFVADISSPDFTIQKKFDVIICDAPCSGSGTWSRTPEQLFFFKKEKISHYSDLQKKIVSNALKALGENGWLLYITCSVFKKENEEVVEFIQQNQSVRPVSMHYLKGYNKKADSLFIALFNKA